MSFEIMDDLAQIRRLDPAGMAALIAGLPGQIEKSPAIVDATAWPAGAAVDFDSIIVLGMGGSAIGGDLVRSYLADTLTVPMMVVRNYEVPEFVADKTLVFASSYSGHTEETLSAVSVAQSRGCRIVAFTTGGELAQKAVANNWPLVRLPNGFPPRAALGFSFSTLLLALGKFGLHTGSSPLLKNLAGFLAARNKNLEPEVPFAENEAKKLAAAIYGRVPVIYGAAGAPAVVATRWKGQLCENAENLAFAGEAPEFNHNEVVGWGRPPGSVDKLMAVILRSGDDHPRITRRFAIVYALFTQKEIPVQNVIAVGENPLQRLFSLIQLGDWVSFYVAILNGVNPTEITAIDYLKNELEQKG